jgi:predicted metal-binding protein
VFSDEVRKLCEKNTCRMFGTSWACPPAVGSVEHCRERCGVYENVFVFTALSKLKEKYDMNEWLEALVRHEGITEKVVEIFRSEFDKILILSTEGCTVCKKCAYPKECRFPDRMFPAVESFGILVDQSADNCGLSYCNGKNTITYFSMTFF